MPGEEGIPGRARRCRSARDADAKVWRAIKGFLGLGS